MKNTENSKIFSYDVFDTLLTRSVINPSSILLLVRDRLINDRKFSDIPRNLAYHIHEIRSHYEVAPPKCFSLHDIYSSIEKNYSLTRKQALAIQRLEEDLEVLSIVPILERIHEVECHISQGERVIFISDMVLGEEVLRRMLKKLSPLFANVPLYVSSVYKATKNQGDLFDVVRKLENISDETWIHTGDDRTADFLSPMKKNIKARLIEKYKITGFERYISKAEETSPYVHYLLGCAKNSRFFHQELDKNYKFHAGLVGAQLFIPYVEWVLDICTQRNVEHLLFISRDGYIPKLIADKIIAIKNLKIATSYFYGSRLAWRNEKDALKIQYYSKNIQGDCGKYAFVDLFGSGESLNTLMEHSQEKDISRISCFYFGDIVNGVHKFDWTRFSFAPFISTNDRIEIFGKSPEGSCLGYEINSEHKIVPKIDNEETEALTKFGFGEFVQGVNCFLDFYCKNYSLLELINKDTDQAARIFMEKITFLPSMYELKYLMNFPRFPKNLIKYNLISNNSRIARSYLKKIKYIFRTIGRKRLFSVLRD